MNVYLKNIVVAFSALFIISLLVCHPSFAGSSTQLGSTYDLSPDEINLEDSTAQTIALYSAIGGYVTYNHYGSGTTRSNIYLAANGTGTSCSLAFYIGHGWTGNVWNGLFLEQQWCIFEDNSGMVFDKDIFPYSSNQNVRFAFLYCCKSGDTIGGTQFWSGTPFGMPYAWLHTTSLNSDGYASPDSGDRVFLGFHEGAPELISGDQTCNFRGFVTGFYYAALCSGRNYTVNQALNYAATQYNPACTRFSDTDLYNGIYHLEPGGGYPYWVLDSQMKVYGNGNICLSSSRPSCAMKTKTNGYFYFPSGTPPLYVGVQIQLLFNDGGIVGDQIHGVSPYPLYTGPYPDGSVDIYDSLLIGAKYGLSEGQSGWEYMADVVPNRVIDMYDALTISGNYLKTGTYSPDFTNVTVAFYYGGHLVDKRVDSKGFVTIPYGTSFTVKRNSTPIGAMAIFWSRV
jgi:hypothetical protein